MKSSVQWLLLVFVGGMLIPSTVSAQDSGAGQTVTDKKSSGDAGKDEKESAATKDVEKKATLNAQKKATPKPRYVSFSNGRTRLDTRYWPIIGKPNAKYILVEMFDYTCPHCRRAHQSIHGARQRYGDDFAVVTLPVPLNRGCNPYASGNNPKHAEACELARIAVAVWRVKRSKFEGFHDWVFKGYNAPTAYTARLQAEKMVGKEALTKELAKPVASKYIAKHVEFYRRAGGGAVPKLLFPRATVLGEPGSTDSLCNMIKRELAAR